MGLLGLGKKKEVKVESCGCGCGGACNTTTMETAKQAMQEEQSVKVLGPGCSKCNELEANTKAALEQLGMETEIGHVTDFTQIAAYGVMSTPALVIDGKVVAYGKVLKTDEVLTILKKVRG